MLAFHPLTEREDIMYIWNVPYGDLIRIVDNVSQEKYQGNVIFNRTPEQNGRSLVFTLRCNDSKGPGHRIGRSGRRMVSACWHVHRDVMQAIFDVFPNARIKSSVADYRGTDDFERSFPDTYYKNIGSQIEPTYFGDACDCE